MKHNSDIWINPVGGMGDMLMLGGILKQVLDHEPARRFKMVRRTRYGIVFRNHPAISEIGFPPVGSTIKSVTYWDNHIGPGQDRPYQVLAKMFGLPTPIEEVLYLAASEKISPLLEEMIPWGEVNIFISPSSDSPRKTMSPILWEKLTCRLKKDGFNIIQVGQAKDTYIKSAYSLLGLTTLAEVAALIERADLVITLDNFIMHLAGMVGTPAVALWGPTSKEIFGRPEHLHLASEMICPESNSCIGPGLAENYSTPCPLMDKHCMDQIPVDDIYRAVHTVLKNTRQVT